MAVVAVLLLIFLAMTGLSSAIYCVCRDGVSDSVMQKDIDYACGAGADCSPIMQTGACYNPNTLKDHCNYAINSYFQKKSQVNGSCDFSGTAMTVSTLSSTNSACVYPASPSTAGNSTTPSTSTTPSSTAATPSTATPSTFTPSTPATTTTSYPPFGSSTYNSKASIPLHHQNTHLFWSFPLGLLLSGPMLLRV